MMLRDVLPGSRRAEGEGRVWNVWVPTFIEGAEGFMGMGALGRFCWRYQAKILWPNFWGLELAPATAMRGEDMKVRAAVCIVGFAAGFDTFVGFVGFVGFVTFVDFGLEVLSVVVGFGRWVCDLVVAGISGWCLVAFSVGWWMILFH